MGKYIRFHLYRMIAALYITAERVLAHFWMLFFWLFGFFSLWLLQIPQILHRWVEIGTAIIFFVGVVWFFSRGLKNLNLLPEWRDVLRRVEQDSHLKHRPFSNMDDRLANAEGEASEALWRASRQNLSNAALKKIKRPRMRPVLPQRDPYAVRGFLLLLVLIAVVMAGSGWDQRIWRGMVPVLPRFIEAPDETVIMWIKTPDYTGMGEIVLKGKGHAEATPITIPEGSVLKAHISGWFGTPVITMGETQHSMTMLSPGSYSAEIEIENTDSIKIRQNLLTRAQWPVIFKPDTPPSITVRGAVENTQAGKIKLPLSVRDDYSVETLTLTLRYPDGEIQAPPLGAPITEQRSVMSAANIDFEINPEFDFSWHPWAGQDVIIDIVVSDHKKQTVQADPITLTLPERNFQHPTAKKLIDLRKRLIWTPHAAAENIVIEIENILIYPERYHSDPLVFLSLRTALSRLRMADDPETAARIVELLWDVALRVEDGNLSLAHRDFMQAQKALQEALKDPSATPEDIAQKMDAMRQAMAAYLREMFREMSKRMSDQNIEQPMMTPEMVMRHINPEDLAAFLDKMMAEAMSGNRDTAREMLAEMERFMNMLDPANMTSEMPKDMQGMMESLEIVEEIIREQQALLDETQRQAGSENKPQTYAEPLQPNTELLREWGLDETLPPPPQETHSPDTTPKRNIDSRPSAQTQNAIRAKLGEAMVIMDEKAGKIPDAFGKADIAMKNSSSQLDENNPAQSIPHQEDAIRALTEGQEETGQQLAKRLQQMMQFSFGAGGRTDPLGRPLQDGENGAPWSRSNVKIPDAAERRKVQEILEDLRKKSGELTRPDYELDYFRRLMRQF